VPLRLGLVDEVTGESLPAALLMYNGRTLIEAGGAVHVEPSCPITLKAFWLQPSSLQAESSGPITLRALWFRFQPLCL
jgi:hypothetical protein